MSRLPDDIWLVDLDSNKLTAPSGPHDDIPALPEPEGTILKNHLKQVTQRLFSINMWSKQINQLNDIFQILPVRHLKHIFFEICDIGWIFFMWIWIYAYMCFFLSFLFLSFLPFHLVIDKFLLLLCLKTIFLIY